MNPTPPRGMMVSPSERGGSRDGSLSLGGRIVVSDRLLAALGGLVEAETIGELRLKGFRRPVFAHNVLRLVASA